MTLHWRLNSKWQDPELIEGLVVNDGDVFEQCNFASASATGAIFAGKKDLVFVRCNLANSVVHASSKFKQCQVGNYSMCYHLYLNDGVSLPGLTPEVDNCRHVVETDDTDPQNIIYERKNEWLGRRNITDMTDEETKTILAPYDSIRKQLQRRPKWAQ